MTDHSKSSAAIVACLLAACGAGGEPASSPGHALTVEPATRDVARGGQATFSARIDGAPSSAVTWSVQEGAAGGSVAAGFYTPPASEGTFHVVAAAVADPTVQGSATVRVQTAAGPTLDRFGVRELYQTSAGGREWFLPATADVADAEWVPEAAGITSLGSGVFRWDGEAGTDSQIRMNVHSPADKPWWRNVEMTMYSRSRGKVMGATCTQHWELEARGERHTDGSTVAWNRINDGVPAPAGTATWPWYAAFSGAQAVNARCLGTTYHGNLYVTGNPNGQAVLEKEISHTAGYADDWRGVSNLGPIAAGAWVGYKLVARNAGAGTRVHLELWEDRLADGTWTLASAFDDTGSGAGSWGASSALDGCGASPYGYAADQVLTWAGPWLGFRSDCQGIDFRWLSAREIDPLP